MLTGKPHLVAEVELTDLSDALSGWRWLLGVDWSAFLVSAAGDVFLINPVGEIARLDTGTATLERIADTRADFESALNNPAVVEDWFLERVVDDLRAQDKRLGRGQCYGFTILPIFKEGSYDAANRYCLSVVEYIRSSGDIHMQLRDIPDGESVRIQIVD